MKKLAIFLCLATGIILKTNVSAQEHSSENDGKVIYAVAVNLVPDGFNVPLIGFVNIARGNHSSLHAGFVNVNYKNFQGAQFGYFNTVGMELKGVQAGFINSTASNLTGLQYGFINTVGGSSTGAQLGFINTTARDYKGIQAGFINTTAGKTKGIQGGFINTSADSLQGAQFGFVNTSGKNTKGAQFGFVNASRKLDGLQVGFINVVDSLEQGIPIGFISVIKNGGYQALELGMNEIYPYNLAFKLGVRKFYTSINVAYNPEWENGLATGAGIGTILPIGEKLFFNPELTTLNTVGKNTQITTSISAGFGYNFTPNFHIIAAPALSWHYKPKNDADNNPFMPVFQQNSNKSDLIIWFRIELRYIFQGF